MSDPEHFIARWSRRKRQAAEDAEGTTSSSAPEPTDPPATLVDEGVHRDAPPGRTIAAGGSEPAFDLTRLPSLESITAETDLRAFLTPGVPSELTRAALRRAWAADPKIRDFEGLADYDWDFNTPGAMPGFGPLDMTDELRRAVSDMVGRNLKPDEPERTTPIAEVEQGPPPTIESASELVTNQPVAPTVENPGRLGTSVGISQDEPVNSDDKPAACDELTRSKQSLVAAQNSPRKVENVPGIIGRPHGRALPK